MRRAARLRLYLSILLSANLKGRHGYDSDSVKALLEIDFKKAKCISVEDPVAQANDHVEFLLDSAELRLREAALCGWNFRGEILENAIQILVSGYYNISYHH